MINKRYFYQEHDKEFKTYLSISKFASKDLILKIGEFIDCLMNEVCISKNRQVLYSLIEFF